MLVGFTEPGRTVEQITILLQIRRDVLAGLRGGAARHQFGLPSILAEALETPIYRLSPLFLSDKRRNAKRKVISPLFVIHRQDQRKTKRKRLCVIKRPRQPQLHFPRLCIYSGIAIACHLILWKALQQKSTFEPEPLSSAQLRQYPILPLPLSPFTCGRAFPSLSLSAQAKDTKLESFQVTERQPRAQTHAPVIQYGLPKPTLSTVPPYMGSVTVLP